MDYGLAGYQKFKSFRKADEPSKNVCASFKDNNRK